jgi:Rhodanese-like domain
MSAKNTIFNYFLNGLTVVIAALTLGFLARQYILPANDAPQPEGPRVGDRINLPGESIPTSATSTLVFAMQIGCHWCEASSDFYRDLIRSNSKGVVHFVAVLPASIEQDRRFLTYLSLPFEDVRQVSLSALNVSGTPTLLLLGSDARVQKAWTGFLTSEAESEVFRNLGLIRVSTQSEKSVKPFVFRNSYPETNTAKSVTQQPSRRFLREAALRADVLSADQILLLRQTEKVLPIIDIRPQPEFEKGHIRGSLNIPQDEFEVRVVHEVSKESPVVVYCHYSAPCESQREAEGVETLCKLDQHWLHELGYPEVKILSDDLAQLQTAGVPIVGSPAEKFVSGSTPVLN